MLTDIKEKTVVEDKPKALVVEAGKEHIKFAAPICEMIETAAKIRGTGISKRDPKYIEEKIYENKAIIAMHEGQPVGFCYIETWEHGKYVANSGLIVHPSFRKTGLARKIKEKAFALSRKRFPEAKIVGITTSLAVMKINSNLGYRPVTFSELPNDDAFWKGCASCLNYDVLTRTGRKMCLCTGMLFSPEKK